MKDRSRQLWLAWLALVVMEVSLEPATAQEIVANTSPSSSSCNDNFTSVARLADPVSILRLQLDGCSESLSGLVTSRLAFTVEPSSSRNTSYVSTYPPNLVEPVYSYAPVANARFGVLAFRMTNVTASAPEMAGVLIRIPRDQLRAIVVEAGSPFYVSVDGGFSRLSSIGIEAGYSLHHWGDITDLGAHLRADLKSNSVPLSLSVDGNGARVVIRSGSLIESVQIRSFGSTIDIKGDVECGPESNCYILGGSEETTTGGTEILFEGSVRGTIATSVAPPNPIENVSVPSVKVNDPYFIGNPCSVLRSTEGGTLRCTPTNETVTMDPWFSCLNLIDSPLGSIACSLVSDADPGTCSCSVIEDRAIVPGLGTSGGDSDYNRSPTTPSVALLTFGLLTLTLIPMAT
jgi:hypothetical protein